MYQADQRLRVPPDLIGCLAFWYAIRLGRAAENAAGTEGLVQASIGDPHFVTSYVLVMQ
jgi:hypothetical protein